MIKFSYFDLTSIQTIVLESRISKYPPVIAIGPQESCPSMIFALSNTVNLVVE
jgi:hypothetical protein